MKNVSLIVNGILGVAVIALFVLYFTNKSSLTQSGKEVSIQMDDTVFTRPPVAYINTDSLLMNYKYAKDLNETLMRKAETSRASLTQKGIKLEADMKEFQRKYENNAFLSPERAQQEQTSLMKRQQELQELTERIQQELSMEQMKMNQQMTDTVISALKEYNKKKNYQMIYNNVGGNSTILIADDMYNITNEVTEFLNKKYTPGKK